jgi:hypothetical protein
LPHTIAAWLILPIRGVGHRLFFKRDLYFENSLSSWGLY